MYERYWLEFQISPEINYENKKASYLTTLGSKIIQPSKALSYIRRLYVIQIKA